MGGPRITPARIVKIIAVNCLVFVVLLILVGGVAEIALHRAIPASSGGSIFEYTLETERYKVMKKNAGIVAHGVELQTNSEGYRDHRPSFPPREPDRYRIVVLGDSFTVCAGVEYERIWTRLLEDGLRREFPGAEVFNLAVGGYNVIRHRLHLEEVGLDLEPDLVLLALYPENDFSNRSYHLNRRIAQGLEEPAPTPWYDSFYTFRVYLRPAMGRLKSILGSRRDAGPSEDAGEAREQNLAALHAIAAITRERGIDLQVVILPSTWEYSGQRGRVAEVRSDLDRLGIPYLDLLEPFERSGVRERDLRLNAIDAHPNERYNALVAEHLTPWLVQAISRER